MMLGGENIIQVNWRYMVNKEGGETGSKRPTGSESKYKLRMGNVRKKLDEVSDLNNQFNVRKSRKQGNRLSKYRRKTANARERMRMGEINTAFERLKEKIPLPATNKQNKCEKLTKINLLHIAINYIHTLEDILETGDRDVAIHPEELIVNPFRRETNSMIEDENTETEMEDVNTTNAPNTNITCQSSRLLDSSSPDSGIQEDSEPEFPDWTELNSTLDLKSPAEVTLYSPPLASAACRDLGPLCSNIKTEIFQLTPLDSSRDKVTRRKPVTLMTRSPHLIVDKNSTLSNATIGLLTASNIEENSEIFNCEDSPFSSLEQDDLFQEIHSSIYPIDSVDITFSHHDQYKVI